jgi:hypothetical protein
MAGPNPYRCTCLCQATKVLVEVVVLVAHLQLQPCQLLLLLHRAARDQESRLVHDVPVRCTCWQQAAVLQTNNSIH